MNLFKKNYKPNIANLKGRNGRDIIKIILSTPPADLTLLKARAKECDLSRIAETSHAKQ